MRKIIFILLSLSLKLFTLNYGLYDLQLYQSYNSELPWGINDNALWQGKGYNVNSSFGVWAEHNGFKISLNPSLSHSTNENFETIKGVNGSEYSYYRTNIDWFQRPGEDSYTIYDWGDSEVRYSTESVSIGIGTDNPWIGPGKRNSLILGDNASSFPQVDFSFKKNFKYLGNFKFYTLMGLLQSSEFYKFNKNEFTDHLGLISIEYSFPFWKNLTLGVHRTSQSPLEDIGFAEVMDVYDFGLIRSIADNGKDQSDGRLSLSFSLKIPERNLELFGELGKEDYSPGPRYVLRAPFHAAGYTLGFTKDLFKDSSEDDHYFSLLGEITDLTWSMDYFIDLGRGGGFYRHYHLLGYANRGQLLGASVGPGGNSQYFSIKRFSGDWVYGLFFERRERDNEQLYSSPTPFVDIKRVDASFSIGAELFKKWTNFYLKSQVIWIDNINRNYIEENDITSFHVNLLLGYSF